MKDIYYIVAHRDQAHIDSFKTRYADFNTSVIPQIFKDDLNFDVVNYERSKSWGTSHVIYYIETKQLDKQLVFRANTGYGNPEVVMLTEKLITEEVANIGVPTNKVIHVDVTRKRYKFDYQIQEKIVGNDLEDHFKGVKSDYDEMSYQLGRYVAMLGQLTYDGFGYFKEDETLKEKLKGTKHSFQDYILVSLDEDIAYLINEKILTKKQAKTVKSLFDEYKSVMEIDRGVLVHHDLADHNIMFKDNKITAIFDWETAVIGDFVLDLASCPTWTTHYPREELLIEGYKSITPLPNHFQEKMDIYRLRTLLWKMVFAIRADILNQERAQRFYDALKPFGKIIS